MSMVRYVPASPERASVAALADVYAANFVRLIRLATVLVDSSAEGEDIAQEAYFRVCRNARLPEDEAVLLAYLHRTVVNLCRSALRRRRVERAYRSRHHEELIDDHDERAIIERGVILVALRRLPRRSREVLVLRYLLDLSVTETAHVLDLSVGAVTSYTSRGLVQLSTIYEDGQ